MNQYINSAIVMETGDHSKNVVSPTSHMSRRIGTRIAVLLALSFMFGCNKDEADESIQIEEIVYYQPDLNDTNLQLRFGIKSKNQILITYEHTGAKKDSSACFFNYDEIEKKGCYMVFFPNKMIQFMTSSQTELSKSVFEAEITDSFIYLREYEYDWNNNKVSFVDELSYKNDDSFQLRNANGKDDPPRIATTIVEKGLKTGENAWKKSSNIKFGGVEGAFSAKAREKVGEIYENTNKSVAEMHKNDPNILNKTGVKSFKNIKIAVNDYERDVLEKIESWLTKRGNDIWNFVPWVFQAAHDAIFHRGDWVLINGVKWATRNVGAKSPEDAGGYYKWNNGTPATTWLKANDPSPEGFRIPTYSEIKSLLSAGDNIIIQKGVIGKKFTDKESGKSIFLPAGGYHSNGTLLNCDVIRYGMNHCNCFYWSSTPLFDFSTSAYSLGRVTIDAYYVSGTSDINFGFNIRPVVK